MARRTHSRSRQRRPIAERVQVLRERLERMELGQDHLDLLATVGHEPALLAGGARFEPVQSVELEGFFAMLGERFGAEPSAIGMIAAAEWALLQTQPRCSIESCWAAKNGNLPAKLLQSARAFLDRPSREARQSLDSMSASVEPLLSGRLECEAHRHTLPAALGAARGCQSIDDKTDDFIKHSLEVVSSVSDLADRLGGEVEGARELQALAHVKSALCQWALAGHMFRHDLEIDSRQVRGNVHA